jgi:hypothetical protein
MDIVHVAPSDAAATEAAAAAVLAQPQSQPLFATEVVGAPAGPPSGVDTPLAPMPHSSKKRKAKSAATVESEDEAKRFLAEIGGDVRAV